MDFEEASPLLLTISGKFGVRPDVPQEMPIFLGRLVGSYAGEVSSFEKWLHEQLDQNFTSMAERPRWLQDPQWPFRNEVPMVFVGQIDRRVGEMDVSFYVFKDKFIGVTKVVTQVLGVVGNSAPPR